MKYIFAVLFAVLFTSMGSIAQNYDDDPKPYSLREEYKDIINYKSLPSNFTTPAYDNDSLYYELNKDTDESNTSPYVFCSGFAKKFDEPLKFEKVSTKIKIDVGTVYVYKLTSPTAEGLSLLLANVKMPDSLLLSYFHEQPRWPYYEHHCEDSRFGEFNNMPRGGAKELYVELFIPNGFTGDFNCDITGWSYNCSKIKKDISSWIFNKYK